MTHDYAEQAKVMKAFCDENRLKILALLRAGSSVPACCWSIWRSVNPRCPII